MTPAALRALGDRFDRLRLRHGRNFAIEDLADSLTVGTTKPLDFATPAGQAIVIAVCKAVGGEHWAAIHRELTTGHAKGARITRIRDEACWILSERGFGDAEIGALVNRDRTSVVSSRARFRVRMDKDQLLRRHMERVMGVVGEAQVAA